MARPMVAVLWRRLRPIAVGAPTAVLRVQRDGAGFGTSMCLRLALWVVSGARRWGVAQSHVGALSLWAAVVKCLEGNLG